MHSITIDVNEWTVTVGQDHVLKGQWVTFYLALALRRLTAESPSLDCQELHLLWPWSLKQAGSGGKEVSRHIDQLSKWGLVGLIAHGGKTKRWRLDIAPEKITFRPSLERCRAWLEEKRNDPLNEAGKVPRLLIAWLEHTTGAIICLVQGRVREGLDLIEAAKAEATGWMLLGAITELVEIRLLARVGEYPYFDDFPFLSRCDDAIGRTLRIRAELAQALEPGRPPESCRNLVLSLQGLPDINGLGTAYNALGALFRRKGQYDVAEQCLRYAAALLVASFDLPTLQAALFNLGHTLSKQADNDQDLREALRLIELDRMIYSALGIGGDSAQAEVVAGAICLKLGELAAAKEWLERGRELAESLDSDYNSACIERLHARILWVEAWREHQTVPKQDQGIILTIYRIAREMLFQAGFDTDSIDDEITHFRRGERPKWVPQP
jgi:tetratricopeptide (TPR) repeat protein